MSVRKPAEAAVVAAPVREPAPVFTRYGETVAALSARVQRACACGAASGPSSRCAACAAEERLGPPGISLGSPGDAYEQEAERVADGIVVGAPASVRGGGDVVMLRRVPVEGEEETLQAKRAGEASGFPLAEAAAVTGSRGTPLGSPERAFFEPRFGRDLSHVRLHTNADASRAAAAIGARAYTLRNHIAFGAGEYRPDTLEGRRLIAHEITHTLQQAASAAPAALRRQPTSLGAIPQSERRAIRIQTVDVAVPQERIDAFFTLMPSGRPSESVSIGAASSFGAGIDASLHTGLASVGAWLAGSTNALPPDSSVEVALDLSAHGGANRRYRFTRFNHTTGRGSRATTTEVILVEDVGPVAAVAAHGAASSITIGSNSYRVVGSWTDPQFSLLHHALTLLPPAAQAAANGLAFRRRSGSSAGGEAGEYDPVAEEVRLFDNAFDDRSVRLGGQPASVRNIVHEIGHALDLRPLEAEWQRFNTAGQTSGARGRLERQRSLSGSRYELDASGTWNREIERGDRAPEFRAAVRADGVRNDDSGRTTPEGTTATLRGGPTTYADTDYEELFAESFMLYVNDPDRLQALRPRTFDYFRRRYPR